MPKTFMKAFDLHNSLFHVLLILLLCLLAYSNTFTVPFLFDDEPNIITNPIIKDLRNYSNPSNTDVFSELDVYPMYKNRFIGSFSFALNYRLHGLDVTGYHVVNLFIHIINALLVYLLIVLSFRTPFLNNISFKGYSDFIALFSALFFACHPIQTQAVTYIVQRFTSLAAMFYLLSLVSYIRWRLLDIQNPDSGRKGFFRFKSMFFYMASLIFAVFAMNTKEFAFTLPVIILVYELMFFEGKIRRRVLYLIPVFLTMLIIPLNLLGIDKPVGELLGNMSHATRLKTDISRWDYLFTQFAVIVTYIRLIFLPINQNLDYDFPLYHYFFDPVVLASFSFLLAIFGLGVYLFYRYRGQAPHTRLISFGILWFFITLSVESSVIPILDIIFEHRMYLPSVGVFLAISTSLFIVAERLKGKWEGIGRAVVSVLAVIIVMLTGTTYARNSVWKDEVNLWEDVVHKSPENLRAHYNLGIAYQSQGLIDKAIQHYLIAIRLSPGNPDPHINLGTAYRLKGLIDKAIEQYRIAINLNPAYAEAHYNLGNAYMSRGLIDKAVEQYRVVIRLDPAYTKAHYNLGIAYQSQGLIDEAIEQYETSIRLRPDWVMPHFRLGRIFFESGDMDKARRKFEKILQINPQYHEARTLLDSIMQRKDHL